MRAAGRLAAETLRYVEPFVKPGISTEEINTLVHNYIVERGAYPSPLNYKGFPKSVCTSFRILFIFLTSVTLQRASRVKFVMAM